MKFKDLIKSHSWLTIEMILLKLYPDQEEMVEEYKNVFESLQILEPENNEIYIELNEYEYDQIEENVSKSTFVDVSGRELKLQSNPVLETFAIEFEKWEKWLGMNLEPETLNKFSEPEIIAHCLYEMTFC